MIFIISDYSITVKWLLSFQIIEVWQLFAVISDCNMAAIISDNRMFGKMVAVIQIVVL